MRALARPLHPALFLTLPLSCPLGCAALRCCRCPQAVEPSTLVPLAHGGAKQVFLVGDPVQLPATVMSQVRPALA